MYRRISFYFILFYFILLYFILFYFKGPHLQHREFPRLGFEGSNWSCCLRTTTARPDPSRVCDLHRSSRFPNPLSEARDGTCILLDASEICFRRATMGAPKKDIFDFFWCWIGLEKHDETGRGVNVRIFFLDVRNYLWRLKLWAHHLDFDETMKGHLIKSSALGKAYLQDLSRSIVVYFAYEAREGVTLKRGEERVRGSGRLKSHFLRFSVETKAAYSLVSF